MLLKRAISFVVEQGENVKTASYSGEIVAGSLLVPESRVIARMLLDNVSGDDWNRAILVENVLQKRSQATAKRQAKLIRQRLETVTPAFWRLVSEEPKDVCTQTLLAAAIKHSRLLGDFMLHVLAEHVRTYKEALEKRDWRLYLEACAQVDPEMENWAESTRNKLGQVVFRILAEAKYVDSTKSLKIQPVTVIPVVRKLLIDNDDSYALRCMELGQ